MVFPSERPSTRVLVTGLEGFTGRYVGAELRQAGYEVFGLSSKVGADTDDLVDLLDANALAQIVQKIRPQVVIHLAAIAFVAHGDTEAIYRTNIMGTRNLLSALVSLQEHPSCVLLASSANVYGNAQGCEGPLDELTPLAPLNDYAVSKLAMEYMARTWAERLPILFSRPFNYTGVGQSPQFLIPKIVDHFRRGERHIELGNLDVWREFTDVRAVAWAYRRLLETHNEVDTFNICTGSTYSLREVIAMMEEIAGYSIDVSVNPAFVRTNEVRRLQGSGMRLQGRIGTLPAYSLRETLLWMYQAPPHG